MLSDCKIRAKRFPSIERLAAFSQSPQTALGDGALVTNLTSLDGSRTRFTINSRDRAENNLSPSRRSAKGRGQRVFALGEGLVVIAMPCINAHPLTRTEDGATSPPVAAAKGGEVMISNAAPRQNPAFLTGTRHNTPVVQVIHPSGVGYKDIDFSWMIGRAITGVSFHEPSLWCFNFGSDENMGVECLWRIVEQGRVVLTREDHGQKFGLPAPIDAAIAAMKLLVDRRITKGQLGAATTDIVIELSGDMCLEIIADSSGYESWKLRDPFGTEYFAQGGGQISQWKR